MSGANHLDGLLFSGASALAIAWVAMLAPWLARSAGARLRSALARDIQATRDASVDELMPGVLSARARRVAVPVLGGFWIMAFVMLWLRVGISSPTAWAYSVFIGALLLLSLIDLDTQLLPSSLVGSVLWAGIFASACEIVPLPVERAIFGAAAGWTLFSIPNWLLAVSRTGDQVAVGEGDVSLIAACGTWLGPQPVIIAGCIAVVGALIVRSIMAMRGSKHEAFVYFPFGPFISFAVIVVMCTNPFHLFVA